MLKIFTPVEPTKIFNGSPKELERTMTLQIEIGAFAGSGALDDDLDTIAAQIEDVFANDPFLTETASDTTLMNSLLEIDANGEKPVGVLTLEFDVRYYTRPVRKPSGAQLKKLQTVNTKMDLPPKDGTVEIEGEVNLP
jgi:hypothetical protein